MPMTELLIPDTIKLKDGPTDFFTYATEDIKHDHLAHNRIRVFQGHAVRVTKSGMADDDATCRWGCGLRFRVLGLGLEFGS